MRNAARKNVELAVVLPVGPTCQLAYVVDTIESIRYYIRSSHVIIVLDDSGESLCAGLPDVFDNVDVIATQGNMGKEAGLYINLSHGFAYAHEHYEFKVLLRLDTDALVIGPDPEKDAIECFDQHPELGMLGSYRVDCNGDPRDFSWPRRKLTQKLKVNLALLRHPGAWRSWWFIYRVSRRSIKYGYEPGEHCLGGAYFVSAECIRRLVRHQLLARKEFFWSELQEDQIFGLLVRAVGMQHGDFSTGSFPMGLRWRGLPDSPATLVANKKKVTHSTRFFGDENEFAIRTFFKAQRSLDQV
ncbi:hypothetical protein FNL37_0716 [Methylovorus glucosotrophus]|uniref:hypothetical protein n=1 Tax=Methylovorus glucosotrophus TaxID=266009 RepID=UPI0013311B41|nr:hypothetical protein [Methylovorus glucosotrophus]KAF0843294.1 hypothetical protein FNL37_0716 [Methylovorus glucosotrophus]